MDSAEKQRGASAGGDARRKRKANAAGIQTTNQESPAPGSAERAAAKQSEQSTSASEHRKRFGAMLSELEDIMKQPNPHVAAVAQVAELVQAMLAFGHDLHPLPKEIEDEVVARAERAREILSLIHI